MLTGTESSTFFIAYHHHQSSSLSNLTTFSSCFASLPWSSSLAEFYPCLKAEVNRWRYTCFMLLFAGFRWYFVFLLMLDIFVKSLNYSHGSFVTGFPSVIFTAIDIFKSASASHGLVPSYAKNHSSPNKGRIVVCANSGNVIVHKNFCHLKI